MKYEAIVIGVSAGGLSALNRILPDLPSDFTLAVIIVQHMHTTGDNFLSSYLNDKCNLNVKEVDDKESILKNTIYIAPPNYHLLVEADRTFSLSIDEPVNYARPSIDVLFETAADVYTTNLIGVILTGANTDGSHGLKRIKASGGLSVVQDPLRLKQTRCPGRR